MLNRRNLIKALASAPLFGSTTYAQQVAPTTSEIPPASIGRADFSQSWIPIDGDIVAFIAPDIPEGIAEKYYQQKFQKLEQVDRFFKQSTGKTFIEWFNTEVAGGRYWPGKKISSRSAPANFKSFWEAYLGDGEITALEFIVYMCVFVNECEGNLTSTTERYRPETHPSNPGISYLFDRVIITAPNGKWSKQSYNRSPNQTCRSLFNNNFFNERHGHLPLSRQLAATKETVWDGDRYPIENTSYSGDPTKTGYVLACDFFKFRGRGVIQTTWRSNYAKIVQYVSKYSGANSTVQFYKERWSGWSPDQACTASTNEDWDKLFAQKEILCEAIRIHARDGQYLPLASTTSGLNGDARGSVIAFGDRLGGRGYGQRLKARLYQTCVALEARRR